MKETERGMIRGMIKSVPNMQTDYHAKDSGVRSFGVLMIKHMEASHKSETDHKHGVDDAITRRQTLPTTANHAGQAR